MIMLLLIDVFAVLPEIVPAPESHHGVAALISSHSHIPFGRSFNFQRALRGLSLGLEEMFFIPSLIDKIAPSFLNPFFRKF